MLFVIDPSNIERFLGGDAFKKPMFKIPLSYDFTLARYAGKQKLYYSIEYSTYCNLRLL